MKIVIVLRDIFGSMTSKYYKLASSPDAPGETDDKVFQWKKLTMDAIEFFNSWGDVIRWHPNCLVFRYEDALERQAEVHQQMLTHWGISCPRECLEEAFSLLTKEKMKNEKLFLLTYNFTCRFNFS